MSMHYDYIIAGGGMAGLSLAYYLSRSEKLRNHRVLLLDKEPKQLNDRTWCFWERGEQHPFEQILFCKWKEIEVIGESARWHQHLEEYWYKMLRGIDFYEHVYRQLSQNPQVSLRYEPVEDIQALPEKGLVKSAQQTYEGRWVFDSIFKPDFQASGSYSLLQHFKGWIVETPQPVFNPQVVTLHDFRIAQQGDEARFMYVLPFSTHKALVEFTLFSPTLLEDTAYVQQLKTYLEQQLKLSDYRIEEEENGVIPMSNAPVPVPAYPSVVRIGTSGGYVRPSTGYTFARTQRRLQQIVGNLEAGLAPQHRLTPPFERRFDYYDSVLLNVLTKKRCAGDRFFLQLYQRNHIAQIFDFLEEQTNLLDEMKLMSTTPLQAFIPAAIEEGMRRIFF